MATKQRPKEDAPATPPQLLKLMVAAAVKLEAIEATMPQLRERLEAGGNYRAAGYAALGAILETSELMASLVQLKIALEAEE